jgi:hypothetical protein
MASKVRLILVVALVVSAAFLSSPATAQDPTDLGLSLQDICFRGATPMSDKCYGFIGAIAEIVELDQLDPTQERSFPPTCIPRGLKVEDIYEAIQEPLSKRTFSCSGICTATSSVFSAMAAVYPCKE